MRCCWQGRQVVEFPRLIFCVSNEPCIGPNATRMCRRCWRITQYLHGLGYAPGLQAGTSIERCYFYGNPGSGACVCAVASWFVGWGILDWWSDVTAVGRSVGRRCSWCTAPSYCAVGFAVLVLVDSSVACDATKPAAVLRRCCAGRILLGRVPVHPGDVAGTCGCD